MIYLNASNISPPVPTLPKNAVGFTLFAGADYQLGASALKIRLRASIYNDARDLDPQLTFDQLVSISTPTAPVQTIKGKLAVPISISPWGTSGQAEYIFNVSIAGSGALLPPFSPFNRPETGPILPGYPAAIPSAGVEWQINLSAGSDPTHTYLTSVSADVAPPDFELIGYPTYTTAIDYVTRLPRRAVRQ